MRKTSILLFCILLYGLGFAQTMIQAPLPAHSSVYSPQVRGYWFTAPDCFTITGLQVATEAGTGTQNIAVCRLPAPPPLYSSTTNTFDVLFLTQNDPTTGIIPVNLQIEAGDHIMIIGQRGTSNSYSASGSWTTTIKGQTVNIYRSGMQFSLNTTPPQQLWSLTSGSVSRVHMYYDSLITYNATATVVSGTTVDFTNGADTSFTSVWDFGDGNTGTGPNPQHTYAVSGVYTACSYITNACGTDTVCVTVPLCAILPTANYNSTVSGLSASFTDNSTNGTSYSWDFGDGNSDTIANPSHTYATSGWYQVCLTTTSSCGAVDTYCDSVLACVDPVAAWTYQAQGGDTLNFTDNSTDANAWAWDFGDGNTSSSQNPSHVFAASGNYTICLIASGLCGSDTTCMSVTVCAEALSAGFGWSASGAQVTFADSSIGASGYLWDFGNGNTATTANPVHTYSSNGDFVPCLTVWNDCGDTTTWCGDTITICESPSPSFTFVSQTNGDVAFTQSTGFAGTFAWDFGDGSTSTQPNPTHTYTSNGQFVVCLTATNDCGSTTVCDTVNLVIIGLDPGANGLLVSWTPNPFSQNAQLKVEGNYQEMEVMLYDLQGREVLRTRGTQGTPVEIRRGNLPAGAYIYKIETNDGRSLTGRVVAQ
ncbi:MAG: PKD domain-containing protein [Bacteroidia bacterium]|nr:PKD domain-containing protein [Bacteroidia bacterium]